MQFSQHYHFLWILHWPIIVFVTATHFSEYLCKDVYKFCVYIVSQHRFHVYLLLSAGEINQGKIDIWISMMYSLVHKFMSVSFKEMSFKLFSNALPQAKALTSILLRFECIFTYHSHLIHLNPCGVYITLWRSSSIFWAWKYLLKTTTGYSIWTITAPIWHLPLTSTGENNDNWVEIWVFKQDLS